MRAILIAALMLAACADQRYASDPAYARAKDECSYQIRLAQSGSYAPMSKEVADFVYLLRDCMRLKGY